MNHAEHTTHQHFTQESVAVPAGEFNWLVVTADDQWYQTLTATPGACIPEGIESKLTLPACACHTIPLIANICSPHACSTLMQHSVSPSYFNTEQRSNTNKGFVIYGKVKEGNCPYTRRGVKV